MSLIYNAGPCIDNASPVARHARQLLDCCILLLLCSVIKIILQFCKENALLDSLQAIQVKFVHKPTFVLLVLLLQCQLQACLNPSCVWSVQNECQVSLNTVDSIETFVSEINNGRWDQVLPVVSRLKLPHGKLESLYELVSQCGANAYCAGMHIKHVLHLHQVVLEMVELREVDTARAVLRQTPVFNRMKQEEPDRFLKLEHLCGRTYFDTKYVCDFA